ncbi:MAG TPA: tetratricopeptide repeat protein [Bryobacteraceae bacterium]
MKPQLFLAALLVQFLVAGQTSIEQSHCAEFDESAIVKAIPNRLDQVDSVISAAVAQGKHVCAGMLLGKAAALLSVHGRIRDSEAFAARSLDLLRKNVDPGDPRLLRPLHVLATAMLEQGKFGKAEQAFQQMLQLRAERPEQRGQIHITGGALRQIQGKWKEAESEYLLAYEELTGTAADADAAAALHYLGALYITERRFQEASQVLDRALAIVAVAENAIPLDRVLILNDRAVAHARQREWPAAQEKWHLAIAIADNAGVPETVLRALLNNYSAALRKNHHRREARVVERRASALHRDPAAGAVVDVRELSGISIKKPNSPLTESFRRRRKLMSEVR